MSPVSCGKAGAKKTAGNELWFPLDFSTFDQSNIGHNTI